MSENMISKIKIGNIEYELGTTIDNVDGLQNALDSKATESYVNTQIVAVLPEVSGQISAHNTATDAHNDIRLLIENLSENITPAFVAQPEAPEDTSVVWIDTDDNSSDNILVKGVDYWTETDKTEIVNDVIAALPVYSGEVEVV